MGGAGFNLVSVILIGNFVLLLPHAADYATLLLALLCPVSVGSNNEH